MRSPYSVPLHYARLLPLPLVPVLDEAVYNLQIKKTRYFIIEEQTLRCHRINIIIILRTLGTNNC